MLVWLLVYAVQMSWCCSGVIVSHFLEVNRLDHLNRSPLSSIVSMSRSSLGSESKLLVETLGRLDISSVSDHVHHEVEMSVSGVSAELFVENGLLEHPHDGGSNSGLLETGSNGQNVHMAVGLLVGELSGHHSGNSFGVLSVGIQLAVGEVVAESARRVEELHVEFNVVGDRKSLVAKLMNGVNILVLHGLELFKRQLESLWLLLVRNGSLGEVGKLVEGRRRRQRLVIVCGGVEGDSLG